MGKGYAEGPAAEAAEEERERRARGDGPRRVPLRPAVFGSTKDEPAKHVLGWADELDADALFASGAAWGLHVAPAEVGADGAPIG
jgi:hypothetical protein